LSKFLKQYNIRWLGTFINILYLTAPLIGISTSILNAATFYAVVQYYIHQFAPWITFPVFITFMVLCVFLMLFLFYKFVYPSYYTFLNSQTYIHNNPIRKDLAIIKKKLGIEDNDQE